MDDDPDLFGNLPTVDRDKAFGGQTYDAERDYKRLSGQLRKVYAVMRDGQWHSLDGLAQQAGGTVASVSARIRDLRKKQYGARVVERKHIKEGLFLYRLNK
jgi:hypothetical protein